MGGKRARRLTEVDDLGATLDRVMGTATPAEIGKMGTAAPRVPSALVQLTLPLTTIQNLDMLVEQTKKRRSALVGELIEEAFLRDYVPPARPRIATAKSRK